MKSLPVLLFSILFPLLSIAQPSLPGTWEGAIHISGMNLGITVTFRDSAGALSGTIDIPQQGARGLELRNVLQAGAVVHFELPTGFTTATFSGTLAADSLAGLFSQGAARGTFILVPSAIAAAHKPVEPLPPYVQREVTFRNDSVTLAGTLTIPPTTGPHPALVLLTGSGAQDRNENIFGFEIFKKIADTLTRKGIAVLRFDDRGVGGSSGNPTECTSEDYAGDAHAAVEFLKKQPEIDGRRIGALGHSEGAIAAAILASQYPEEIRFVILMAGPGLKGDSLINSQIVFMARNGGASDNDIRETLALQNKVYAAIRRNDDLAEIRNAIASAIAQKYAELTPRQRSVFPDSATFVASSVERTLGQARTRWFRQFIDLDPAQYLRRIRCPVLALFGELDQQIVTSLNTPVVERALSQDTTASIMVIPKANHLFQRARTGAISEYGSLPKEFAPGFMAALVPWVQRIVAR